MQEGRPRMTIQARVQQAVTASGKSQRTLARELGLSHNAVNMVYRGEYEQLSFRVAIGIARLLDMRLDRFAALYEAERSTNGARHDP